MTPDIDTYRDMVVNFAIVYGMRLLVALVILVIGIWVMKRLNRFIQAVMLRRGVDESLRPFLTSIFSVMLWVLLIVMVISQLGVEMTSFIAILGSAGLAIGLALQGSLSNFAGGVLILTIKPFRVGDYIEAQGQGGTVHIINIFNTVLKTADNKTIYLPNGPLASTVVVNYSVEPTRRVELIFNVSVHNDIGKVRQLIQELISQDERVLPEPEPAIVVTNFAEHAITISTRIWCNRPDYWSLFWDMTERAKATFEQHNIALPVPKREVLSYPESGQQAAALPV
ncbi:mechanosensitive ion channel family protein [Pontibacter akesuensis]|uniref:Small conductance mechanosensitive channel n=1 Tax=Pontibacter akesuensis TaxID=388950 RepID=A0A1I7GZ38_9BACT|nr:mechanosensitive ion channel domain-containing protein [Pontibacter akesuensis]GHA54365.1 mechanosensitive ion channel protein MscS [Pontibacter akesuensis]SFU53683.1 small conductance mechanosensitive channel [Pontibacter akesuensis]